MSVETNTEARIPQILHKWMFWALQKEPLENYSSLWSDSLYGQSISGALCSQNIKAKKGLKNNEHKALYEDKFE